MMDGWERCPRRLIRDLNVSSKAVRLFLLLKTFSGPKGCYPSQQELAASLDDCAEKTVRRCLDELRKAGYIQTRRKWIETPQGPRQTCEYVFVDASKVNGHQSPLTADSDRTSVSLHSSERTLASSQIESERTFGAILNGHDGPCNCDLGTETISCASLDARESDIALRPESVRTPSKRSPKPDLQSQWFCAFWSGIWRKRGKGPAEKAFRRLIKTESDFRLVMAARNRDLPEMLGREENFRPHPATWLNAGDWLESPGDTQPARLTADSILRAAMATDTAIDWSKA